MDASAEVARVAAGANSRFNQVFVFRIGTRSLRMSMKMHQRGKDLERRSRIESANSTTLEARERGGRGRSPGRRVQRMALWMDSSPLLPQRLAPTPTSDPAAISRPLGQKQHEDVPAGDLVLQASCQ